MVPFLGIVQWHGPIDGTQGVCVGELIKVRTSLVYFKYLSLEKNYQKGPLTIKKII